MAENLLPGRYIKGTASVDAGGTIVTPTGATWTDNVWVDDLFFLPSQPLVPPQRIESVNDDGEIVLAYPWPGAAAVVEPYEVRFVGIIERSTAQSRKVLEQLGDVKAWYDIIVEDDAARLALESASKPLPAGYRVLVRLDGVIWMKKTSAFGDWEGPVEFKGDTGNKGWSPVFGVVSDGERRVLQLTAWVGGEGAAPAGVGKYVGLAGLVDDIAQAIDVRGEGFQWGGAYNAASAYEKGSVIRQNGSSFIAAQAVPAGEAPSSASPPVDTPYWAVLAAKGQDGDIDGVTPFWQSRILNDADAAAAREGLGAGDVVGPSGASARRLTVFGDVTGKLLTEASGLTLAEQGRARADIGADVLGGFRNKIINGNFDIWQRGPSFAAATGSRFTADRWRVSGTGSTLAVARTAFSPGITEAFGDFRFGAQITVASSAGTGNFAFLAQKIESVRTFAGKKVTISLAGYADAAKNIAIELVQNFGSGGSPSSFVSVPAGLFAMTTALGKKTLTVDVPSIAGKTIGSNGDDSLELFIWFDAGSSFNARASNLGQQSGVFTLSHISIVEGDATAETDPFSPRHLQQELALCQRYFEAPALLGTCLVRYASIYAHSSNIPFKVEKRVIPSMTISINGSLWSDGSSSPVLYNASASASSFSPIFSLTGGAAGAVGQMAFFYVADAEL